MTFACRHNYASLIYSDLSILLQFVLLEAIVFVNGSYHSLNGTIMDKLRQNFVYIVNVTFPSTKFLDLLEIKIALRPKHILNRSCLVKDSLVRYPVQPNTDTSDSASHAQDVEDFLKKNKSSLF